MIILNRVPGIPNDHSPYRVELAGVCYTITMIEQYVEYYKIRSGKARIGLDGQAVIQRLRNPDFIRSAMPSQELLRYMTNKVSKIPIDIEFSGSKAIKMTLEKR